MSCRIVSKYKEIQSFTNPAFWNIIDTQLPRVKVRSCDASMANVEQGAYDEEEEEEAKMHRCEVCARRNRPDIGIYVVVYSSPVVASRVSGK